MTKPWETLDTVTVDEGELCLLRKDNDFLIKVGNRILMNSALNLTEIALGKMAVEFLGDIAEPKVLIGGLGMGFTLKAALDSLPKKARVIVSEINPVVEKWCKGPMAALTENAVGDNRVEVKLEDVSKTIKCEIGLEGYDAIILDLYEGTFAANRHAEDPYYGKSALKRMKEAIKPGGILSLWTEQVDTQFEKKLEGLGFKVSRKRPGKGGPRHVVYLCHVETK